MVSLIVFDVDGTVLEKNKSRVSESSVNTIEKLAAKGYGIMFASGRSYYELIELFEPFGFEALFAASDGAYLAFEGKTFLDMPIRRNDVICIFNVLKGFLEVRMEFCAKYLSYVYPASNALRTERKNQVKVLNSISDIEDNIYKITVYNVNSFVKSKLKMCLSENLRFAYDRDNTLEIVLKDADKQKAVEVAKDIFKGSVKVIAVGDGENDLPVLKNANIPIAMDSAAVHIKNICLTTVKNICEIEKFL